MVNSTAQKRIFNLEDYYENNLLPKMLSFPSLYLNRNKKMEETRSKESSHRTTPIIECKKERLIDEDKPESSFGR